MIITLITSAWYCSIGFAVGGIFALIAGVLISKELTCGCIRTEYILGSIIVTLIAFIAWPLILIALFGGVISTLTRSLEHR